MRVGVASLALVLVPSLAHGQGARMEQTDSGPRIVASATRSARVPADRVLLYGYVEGTAETPGEAVQRGERKVQTVTDAIRQLGAQTQGLGAVPYGVTPAANVNPYQMSAGQTAYTARFVVRLQATRVDQAASLAAALVTAGASSATASLFETSAADSVRRALYAEALDQARRDAGALAAALGGRLGSVIEASSNAPAVQGSGPTYINFQAGANYGAPSQSPDVVVTASASVRYRFVPR